MKPYHMPCTPPAGRPGHPSAIGDRALAVISHELKQPLSVIRMNASLLQRLPASAVTARVRGIAETIQRAIESQSRIINDLFDFSRVRTGKLMLQRTDVNIGELVLDLVANLGGASGPGRISARMQAAEPLICHADPVRLEQIVGNLLDNAMKFAGPGGQVSVRVLSEEGFARLSVADDGCGIAPEFLPHVFGLFSQAEPAGEGPRSGLGIGLALVHGLTVAHGGFVKATSAGLGRGAEFNVWLPVRQRAGG